jgi:predicted ATPase
MITQVKFSNYKCLPENFPFNLNKINVFTGYNGRGKSSLLQALLMLSQSIDISDTRSIRKLHLSGCFVDLGDFDEIQADDHVDDVKFMLQFDHKDNLNVTLSYSLSDDDIKQAKLDECVIGEKNYFSQIGMVDPNGEGKMELEQLPGFINSELASTKIHFVSADRQGPVKYVDKREIPSNHKVGTHGDFTINTLSTYKDLISAKMNVDEHDTTSHNLREATQLWIDFIMDGGVVSVEDTSKVGSNRDKTKSSVLSMDFAFEGKGNNRQFKAYNVGFGYSYIMSIVVTALIAKPGNIVIIENPEAHLHPLAQLHLTYLLTRLAANDVQVYVETHSDHILNGFRLAALKPNFDISNNDLSFYFFDRDFTVKALAMEKNGKIPNWPKGFFDQIMTELSELTILGAKAER